MAEQQQSRNGGTNAGNWMQLPHPGSAILSHRLLNAVRLYDISNSGEAARGMLKQAAEEVAAMEKALSAVSELTRWIPVTERLPEVPLGKEVPCWVCTEKFVFLSWYVNRPHSEEHDGAEWVVESDSGDPLDCVGWHKYGCNTGYDDFFMPEDDASKIIAWQPIPQPSRYERSDSTKEKNNGL